MAVLAVLGGQSRVLRLLEQGRGSVSGQRHSPQQGDGGDTHEPGSGHRSGLPVWRQQLSQRIERVVQIARAEHVHTNQTLQVTSTGASLRKRPRFTNSSFALARAYVSLRHPRSSASRPIMSFAVQPRISSAIQFQRTTRTSGPMAKAPSTAAASVWSSASTETNPVPSLGWWTGARLWCSLIAPRHPPRIVV